MSKRPPSQTSEEGIKAELRDLTRKTRRLREELREMVTAPSKDLTKGMVHVPPWPKEKRRLSDVAAEAHPRPSSRKSKP